MVDAGVSAVLSKLSEVASAEATALLKVDDQIRELRRSLGYLQAVVRGADQQRRGRVSELLLLWTRETREVAFDVEDAVDEFHLKVETFRVKAKWGHAWYRSAVQLLNGLAMQIFVRHVLSRQISKINERIKEIDRIKENYKIESSPSEIWSVSFSDADAAWDIEYGRAEFRKAEFAILKEHLMNTTKKISHRAVISIVGASGTGKTRLARNLYNDRDVKEYFEVLAWICLPARVRFGQYEDMIYEQIRRQFREEDNEIGSASSSENGGKLKGLLKESKYLVVLDGLADISNWNSLLDLLPEDNPNSRIMLTTQLNVKEIKRTDREIKPTVLHRLDANQTEILFHERVFGADGHLLSAPHGMLRWTYRNSVHNISRGLPLAVIVLGGVLRTKEYPSEWDDVLSQQLETPTGQPKAMRCLWSLAFEDLPHHLKSCFLYFATASENILLDPDRLVRLWIAEGFVASKKGKTLEEVGSGYLKELVCRGLVEVAEKDARGGIKMVAVHNLLHSFVESEAQESCFIEIHHHANVLHPHAVRRLAIHNFVDSYIDIPDHFPKLRSLFCDFLEEEQDSGSRSSVHDGLQRQPQLYWGNPAEWLLRACGCSDSAAGSTKLHQLRIIRGSRFLRVIDLYGLLLARVPDEIGSIIHLRYLGIRNCRLGELPPSISKLDNLQTLDVRKTRVTNVTDEFWEIHGLRHVLAEKLHLSECPSAHLKNLQTLAGAVPAGKWSLVGCPLNRMIYLRSLAMFSISELIVEALSSAVQRMEFLVSLSLSGSLLPSSVFTNPSSRRLEVLALHGKLNSSPSGPFILPNLSKLTLSGSGNLMQGFVDEVAALPNLNEMELLDGSYVEVGLVFHAEGFPSLTKLNLLNLKELEKLELVPGSAPKLALLTKCGCTNLEIITNGWTASLDTMQTTSEPAYDREIQRVEPEEANSGGTPSLTITDRIDSFGIGKVLEMSEPAYDREIQRVEPEEANSGGTPSLTITDRQASFEYVRMGRSLLD